MRALCVGFLLVLLGACAVGRPYYVNVSSLSAPGLDAQQTFDVLPTASAADASSLQFQEYKSYVERTLALQGFQKAQNGELPDLIVYLGYGIGEPQTKTASYSVPVYGQTGVSSAHTTGTVSSTTNAYGNSAMTQSSVTATTTYTPAFGVTGYQQQTTSYDVYGRYISLAGFFTKDWESRGELVPAFETNITSTGTSGDLRKVFPIMLGAASKYVGKSTTKTMKVTVTENDARVLAVLGTP